MATLIARVKDVRRLVLCRLRCESRRLVNLYLGFHHDVALGSGRAFVRRVITKQRPWHMGRWDVARATGNVPFISGASGASVTVIFIVRTVVAFVVVACAIAPGRIVALAIHVKDDPLKLAVLKRAPANDLVKGRADFVFWQATAWHVVLCHCDRRIRRALHGFPITAPFAIRLFRRIARLSGAMDAVGRHDQHACCHGGVTRRPRQS